MYHILKLPGMANNSLACLGCKLWNDLDNTLKNDEHIKPFSSEIS